MFTKTRKRLPVVLTTQEAQELLKQPNRKCPTGYRNYFIMLLAYRAGLRSSEIIHLEVKDIDWHSGDLRVVDGKGGKDREIPLEPYVLDALQRWKDERPNRAKLSSKVSAPGSLSASSPPHTPHS
jgi:integrase/recombinase XerD